MLQINHVWAQQSLCLPPGQDPGAETLVVQSRNAHGCRNLHLNDRYKALVMNIFQRDSKRKGGTHPSLQQGFLLQSLWCTAQHTGREGKELSWEVLGAQAADPGSGASLRARESSLE